MRGFKTLNTAYATIMGVEVMRALRKGQAGIFNLTQDIRGEARIVERTFGIGASPLAEAIEVLVKSSTSNLLDFCGKGTTRRHLVEPNCCDRAILWIYGKPLEI